MNNTEQPEYQLGFALAANANIDIVENTDPKINSNKIYFRVTSARGDTYLYSEHETERAHNRGLKNPEDCVEYHEEELEMIDEPMGFFSRLGYLFNPSDKVVFTRSELERNGFIQDI